MHGYKRPAKGDKGRHFESLSSYWCQYELTRFLSARMPLVILLRSRHVDEGTVLEGTWSECSSTSVLGFVRYEGTSRWQSVTPYPLDQCNRCHFCTTRSDLVRCRALGDEMQGDFSDRSPRRPRL